VVSKLDLVVILAAAAGGLLWIEQGHRIVTDAPTPAELAARTAAEACPDNENVPYSAGCIVFMQGRAVAADQRWRVNAREQTPAALPDAPGPACLPNNENAPYSASCIRFMSGWFWQPNTP
jgi:hypothetical protein